MVEDLFDDPYLDDEDEFYLDDEEEDTDWVLDTPVEDEEEE